jgi:hypothetical protein
MDAARRESVEEALADVEIEAKLLSVVHVLHAAGCTSPSRPPAAAGVRG